MLGEYLRLAFKSLRTNRLRSFLTVLSITIGVTSVILLTSLAQSGLATLIRGVEEVGGTRFIMLWPDQPKKAAGKSGHYLKGLTIEDAEVLKGIPDVERATVLLQEGRKSVRRPGQAERQADLVGTDPDYLSAFVFELAQGRNLTQADMSERRRVTVLGDELASKLFPGEEAVGKEVVLSNERYRVVGRLAYASKSGMSFGFAWNDVALVPLTVLKPDGRVSTITLTSRDPSRNGPLLDRANALLMHRHNGLDDFRFLDFGPMLQGFYAVFYGMILVVGLIAGMSLVIGGVGIMNIMLVAVAERKREIGLRKAVGAPQSAIMRQFLVEAVVLSLFGAGIGTALGVGLAQLSVWVGPMLHKGWVGIVSQPAVAVAVLASAGIGLFFGWYPAKQAASLDPIVSLRSE
jgi:ABC-type antimicrobial peptide transport system, permease component